MDDLGYGDVGFNGHPTTHTPNLDYLAHRGKILTTWYSGCNVCSGSRAALMTGRQWARTGLRAVIGNTEQGGLPLNETTIAQQLKKVGYATAIIGKWHLGQRPIYLPGNRGFDYYVGIPYSDDMGNGYASSCPNEEQEEQSLTMDKRQTIAKNLDSIGDPAGDWLPLVYQEYNKTKILEQPLDFTTLAEKYNDFALKFLDTHKDGPFLLYVPFSHVHTTMDSQPERQYAGCNFKGRTSRGAFGDALAEADWIVGNIIQKLQDLSIEENTLVLFTSDNGPWLAQALSGGSEGLFTGRSAGYWGTGKGSNWEGGLRMPAFAYWKNKIEPFSRSSEIVSSLDVFPTLSKLAGVSSIPKNLDGRDMSEVLLKHNGKSKHDFLFFYGNCFEGGQNYTAEAVRHGKYKAYWCTKPGSGQGSNNATLRKLYNPAPLLFNVEKDPSEAYPISANHYPRDASDLEAVMRMKKAYAMEKATFHRGTIIPEPDGPGEGPGRYGLCCDRSKACYCSNVDSGIFELGTKRHHDWYHSHLGEDEPSPPRTRAQIMLQRQGQ